MRVCRDSSPDLGKRHSAETVSVHLAVRLLREEHQLLQEPGSYVGEVVKVRNVYLPLRKKNPSI